jgi:hypothetical protein
MVWSFNSGYFGETTFGGRPSLARHSVARLSVARPSVARPFRWHDLSVARPYRAPFGATSFGGRTGEGMTFVGTTFGNRRAETERRACRRFLDVTRQP